MKKMFIYVFNSMKDYITDVLSLIKERQFIEALLLLFFVPPFIFLNLVVWSFFKIFEIIIFPFEYTKYVGSSYYKNFKIKYDFGITWWEEYLFYNYSVKNGLDIEFLRDPLRNKVYMKKNNVIYVFDCAISFYFDNDICITYIEDDDVDDDYDEISNYIGKNYKDYELPIKVVLNIKRLKSEDLDKASKCEYLYAYKDLNDLKKL